MPPVIDLPGLAWSLHAPCMSLPGLCRAFPGLPCLRPPFSKCPVVVISSASCPFLCHSPTIPALTYLILFLCVPMSVPCLALCVSGFAVIVMALSVPALSCMFTACPLHAMFASPCPRDAEPVIL